MAASTGVAANVDMSPEAQTLFDRAAECVKRAAAETDNGARELLLEEALRLHRLARAAAEATRRAAS